VSAVPVDLSLNEVETLAAKAARGAGLSWGGAEEIGRVVLVVVLERGLRFFRARDDRPLAPVADLLDFQVLAPRPNNAPNSLPITRKSGGVASQVGR